MPFRNKIQLDNCTKITETISKMSVGTGQGFLKCSCKTGKCLHCNCTESNVSCNSRCHNCDIKKSKIIMIF